MGTGSGWHSRVRIRPRWTPRIGELVAAGYHGHLEPWDAFWGQRYATVLDPDGNSVDLFAPLPATDG